MLGASALDWLFDQVADGALQPFKAKLKDAAAKRELQHIAVEAIEAAVRLLPQLADDLRSRIFLECVAIPLIRDFLLNPAAEVDGCAFADAYIDRFVQSFVKNGELDATLDRIFRTDRGNLAEAFNALTAELAAQCLASAYWAELYHWRASEETRRNVALVVDHLGIARQPKPLPSANLEDAKADARESSRGLREWPSDIQGYRLPRPELDVLINRVRETPSGCTLVLGEAGFGKSALFADLTKRLEDENVPTFAVKADYLDPDIKDVSELSRSLGMKGSIDDEVLALSSRRPVVLLIDQLDAVSDVMDRTSQRMRLLTELARKCASRKEARVHVIVSSRPFEAQHDARFKTLNAVQIRLSLPPYGEVEKVLEGVGLDPKTIPESLRDTLRRPLALKLFVELALSGAETAHLTGSRLLDAWLSSVNLGSPDERAEMLAFLRRLASDMSETETLWRPADAYDAEVPHVVGRSEAAGLVHRRDGQIGFTHQAWLDDFQAKDFSTGRDLGDFAIARQNGLFSRATILRALQRLREFDAPSFQRALKRLLGRAEARRHLRHLVVDLIASQAAPTAEECRWAEHLIRTDVALGRRLVAKATQNWPGWRECLWPLVPTIMLNADLRWAAVQLLITEGASTVENAVEHVRRFWGGSEHDEDVFHTFWRGGMWSPGVKDRVDAIFSRQRIQPFAVNTYSTALEERGAKEAAVEILGLFIASQADADRLDQEFRGIDKLAQSAPEAFAETLFPWFVQLATRERYQRAPWVFDRSKSLPFSWSHDRPGGSLFEAFRTALADTAQKSPDRLVELVRPFYQVEIDEVQGLIAETFAAGAAALASEALSFLLSDNRRFMCGEAHVEDIENVGRTIAGWGSIQLVAAISPHLSYAQVTVLRDAVESWKPYPRQLSEESDPRWRLHRLRWADEARLALLEKLPSNVLPARRLRQIAEWRAGEPKLKPISKAPRMAHSVQPPMSAVQMTKASDDQLMAMFNGIRDDVERLTEGRRWLVGGVSELAGAFAAFGEEHPERAIGLARERFVAGVHESLAGSLVRDLGRAEGVEPATLLDLVYRLVEKGFSSEDWRRDAAWAMGDIGNRSHGLADDDLALLESWIVIVPEVIAERVVHRESLEAANREQNAHLKKEMLSRPVLFGMGGGGVLPQDNFAILSAMASGVLSREPPDCDAWLGILERHLEHPEDPAMWSALIRFRGRALWWADRQRAQAFFERLAEAHPAALADAGVARELFSFRAMLTPRARLQVVRHLLASEEETDRQAAAEFATAAWLVDGPRSEMEQPASECLAGKDEAARIGGLFAAAAVWRESDPVLRAAAHPVLMRFASTGELEAGAISTAINHGRSAIADGYTAELLQACVGNRLLLKACLNGFFTDVLEELLLHPGFDDLVLDVATAAADMLLAPETEQRGGTITGDLVAISISLQRSDDPIRSRAMDLYERLLDAEAYGADEAAQASLRG